LEGRVNAEIVLGEIRLLEASTDWG
jgi:hypothetical protein